MTLSREDFVYKTRANNTFAEWQEVQAHDTALHERLAAAEMAFVIAEQRTEDAQALCEQSQQWHEHASKSVKHYRTELEQSQERVKELEGIIEALKTTARGFRELDEGNFVTLQELEELLNPHHEGE